MQQHLPLVCPAHILSSYVVLRPVIFVVFLLHVPSISVISCHMHLSPGIFADIGKLITVELEKMS